MRRAIAEEGSTVFDAVAFAMITRQAGDGVDATDKPNQGFVTFLLRGLTRTHKHRK
jgi:hypothetical protein